MRRLALFPLLALLALCVLPQTGRPATVNFFGLKAELPEGWKMKKSDQVLLYNKSENSAVIVDQISNDGENASEQVAAQLADAAGVNRNDIGRDKSGALTMSFTQSGEKVDVRIVDGRQRVVMVYAFGSDNDQDASEVAASVAEDVDSPADQIRR